MELIEMITSKENLNRAYKKVIANKGSSGIDGMTVEELSDYIRENEEKIITSIRNKTYVPKPVKGYIYQKTMERKDHWEYQQHWTEQYNKHWHNLYQKSMRKYLVNTAMDSDQEEVVMTQ